MKITIQDGSRTVSIDTETVFKEPDKPTKEVLAPIKQTRKYTKTGKHAVKSRLNQNKGWDIAQKKQILELREQGFSWGKIGKLMGRSGHACNHAHWKLTHHPEWLMQISRKYGTA